MPIRVGKHASASLHGLRRLPAAHGCRVSRARKRAGAGQVLSIAKNIYLITGYQLINNSTRKHRILSMLSTDA